MRSLLTTAAVTLMAVTGALCQTTEHRGVWMPTASFSTPESADATIARAEAANLNALYPLVWVSGGQAWFHSELSPMARSVEPGFDPLGYLLEKAHERGMQVHPWFVNGRTGNYPPDSLPARRPEWLVKSNQPMSTEWYCLSNPEVRQFQTDVIVDLLQRYDVDGIHLDYIRFSSQLYCYCDHCLAEFPRLYDLPPIALEDADFPARLTMVGNPLSEPTTAQPVMLFEDGNPAITLNRVGEGEAAVVNWQLVRYSNDALRHVVRQIIQRFGADDGGVFQLTRSPSPAQERVRTWFEELGFDVTEIGLEDLDQVAAPATVLLYAHYEISPEIVRQLRQLVEAGGHCLFVEGPVRSMDQVELQQLTGMRRPGAFFHALRALAPAPAQEILTAPEPVDLEIERTRLEKWVEYRTLSVTELVRSIAEQTRQVNPDVRISAAVFSTKQEAASLCQDWHGWLEEGIIDHAIPMAYTTDNARLEALFREWREVDPQMERIIPGLAVYMQRDGRDVTRPSELVVSQVELCRAQGTRGVQFFSLPLVNEELSHALASGPFQDAAVPPAGVETEAR